MAANLGDARKRSNTGGSEDSEDRVVLLSGEDMSNVHSESELSDVNEDGHSTKLISERVDIFSKNRSVFQNMRHLYSYYCPQRYKKMWLILFIALLGLILLVMVVVPLHVWDELPQKTCSDLNDDKFAPFIFDPNEQGKFALCRDKELLIEGTLGINHQYSKQEVMNMYEYSSDTSLNVSRLSEHCVQIKWQGLTTVSKPLKDCFNLGNDYWFGGYESQWPINRDFRPPTLFVPRDYTGEDSSNNFGPIIHPVWLSSKGVVIYVDKNVPLSVSFNNSICLHAMPQSLNCMQDDVKGVAVLKYAVCGFQNMTNASKYFLAESENVPSTDDTPNSDILKYPIWSTKNALEEDWTQSDVVDYAQTILNNNYSISLLDINGKYSDYYGDLQFSESKFPNIIEFKNAFNNLGINVAAAVSPFIDYKSPTFAEAIVNDTIYPGHSDIQGDDVVLVKWSNNLGSVLNIIKDSVSTLQQARLNDFMSVNGLATLTFDGGSETYVPRCVYSGNTTLPTQYTTDYVNFIGQMPYSTTASVSVGYFSQNNPVLFRLSARNASSWEFTNNGLRSIIPSALALGLGGYSFVFADSIGNSSKELYIRWLQLTSFMPALQISYPPWKFDTTATNHVKDLIRLHTEIYTNYIEPLIVSKDYPIIRPLWWLEPTNSTFIANNDQFLIGENLLVAPILDPSNNTEHITGSKQVLFPSGTWKCLSSICDNQRFQGLSIHTFINIKLTDLLYFFKV